MGLRDIFWRDPVWRSKAATASPEVLETMATGRFNAFPLIAMPNRGDQMRAAFEAMVSATYGDMYRTQPSVRSVVDFIARNVAQLGLRLYERTSDIERHEASSHPAAMTMRNPNKMTPGQKFIFDLVRDHLVYGNAYAFKSRVRADAPLVLTQLPPARTSVLGPSYFTIDAYRVYRVDGSHFDEPPENIFHWPAATNPNDPRLGLSPLETLRQVLAEDVASQAANVEMLKNGVVKQGYLYSPPDAPEISDEGAKRLQEDWANQQRDSARHTPILFEGREFRDFGISPKDAEMLAGRRFTIEEVCRVYGFPKGLLGIGGVQGGAGSGMDSERTAFYADVLPPICEMLCSYLGISVLQQEYDASKFYFEFDLDEKLQGNDRLTALTSATGAPVLTRNESRAMLNKPPKDGGDELITPLNVAIGGKPSPQVMPIQDPNKPPQDGSHRTDGPTPAGGQSMNGHGKAFLLAKREGQRQRRERYAAEFTAELRKFFKRQETSERHKSDGKAFDLERWIKELGAILLKLMRSSVEREGMIAAAGMGSAFDMALVKHYLEETAKGKAEEINAATRDALHSGDFADVFAEAKDIRAQGTGDTLATKMASFAQSEAAKQTPDVENRIKTWVVNDLETSLHPEMDGETVPLNGRFSNGKEYPPYEHPGCQCMVAVT